MGKYSILGADHDKTHPASYTVMPGREGGPAQVIGPEGELPPGSEEHMAAMQMAGLSHPEGIANFGSQNDPPIRTSNMGLNALKAEALVNPNNDAAPKSPTPSPNAALQPASATTNYSLANNPPAQLNSTLVASTSAGASPPTYVSPKMGF